MAIDWREFLVIAHGLRLSTDGGSQRTSLGRSYYYIYHLVLAEARARHFTGSVPGLHKKLWDWCQQQANVDIRQLGLLGSRMHSVRLHADYNPADFTSPPREISRQLQRARDCELIVAALTGSTPPNPLT